MSNQNHERSFGCWHIHSDIACIWIMRFTFRSRSFWIFCRNFSRISAMKLHPMVNSPLKSMPTLISAPAIFEVERVFMTAPAAAMEATV